MKIRVVKTASNASAVQVVRYQNGRRIIVQHIGSAHNDTDLEELKLSAQEWIKDYSHQLSVFPDESPNKLLHLHHCTFLGVQYNFFHSQLSGLQNKIGFGQLPPLFKDLVSIRVFEPASKLRSLELLEQYFGVRHSRKTYYRLAPDWIALKDEVESRVVSFAKTYYAFSYDLL